MSQPSQNQAVANSTEQGGAQIRSQIPAVDPELAEIVRAWGNLRPEFKQAVLAVIRSASLASFQVERHQAVEAAGPAAGATSNPVPSKREPSE